MSDPKADFRRSYIEKEVREAVREMNRYFEQEGVTTTIAERDLGRIRLSFEELDTKGNLFCRLEDHEKVDAYFIGKNVGRVLTRYLNLGLAKSNTSEAEKIRRVLYHLVAILHVRNQDPEADIDSFPETYPSANDLPIVFTLRETGREKMERITGKPIDLPENPHTEDDKGQKKEFFQEEEKGLPKGDDFPDDPEVEEGLAEFERRKEDRRYDPNQTTDFGFEFDVSDLGHEGDERDEMVRREVDSVKYDGLASDRQANMSEEFQAARTIYLGRRDSTENWRTVLANLLTSREEDSIRYLKGIFNY